MCAALAVFAVGCDRQAPDAVPARSAATDHPAAAGQPPRTGAHVNDKPREDRRIGVGDRVTVGRPGSPDTELTTALNAFVRGAVPDPAGPGPAPGERWDAVEVTVTNTGWAVYDGRIGESFTLIDTEGHAHPAFAPESKLTVGETLTGQGTLQLGQRARGWIVFSLPTDATPARLRFRWNDGAADSQTVWTL